MTDAEVVQVYTNYIGKYMGILPISKIAKALDLTELQVNLIWDQMVTESYQKLIATFPKRTAQIIPFPRKNP